MILSRFSVTSSLIYDFLSKSDRKVSFFQSKEGLKPRPGFLSGLRRHNKRIKLKDYVGSSTLPGRYTATEVRFQLYLHCFCSLMTEWNKEKEHKQAKRTYQNIIFLKLTEELSSFETDRFVLSKTLFTSDKACTITKIWEISYLFVFRPQLLQIGVFPEVISVTSTNAVSFRFCGRRYFSETALSNGGGVRTEDGGVMLVGSDHYVGLEEIQRYL